MGNNYLTELELNEILKKISEEGYMSRNKNNTNTIKIIDVKINNPATIVWFSDGTKETAVCQEVDVFSAEAGVNVCIMKKLLGGTNTYAKAMKKWLSYDKLREETKRLEEEEVENIKNRRRKAEVKKAKRKEKKRKEAIDIQKEAYKLAMKELGLDKPHECSCNK